MLAKHVILSLCMDLPVNPKMNLNPLQITSNLISTQTLQKPILDCRSWWLLGTNKRVVPLWKTTYEGTKIDGITSQCGLEQLIHEPAHIIGQRSSCIDLIFASQPNFVVESDVQSSLHQNFHHQIVFARFNLKVVFPTPY